jgi:hypothetical protein
MNTQVQEPMAKFGSIRVSSLVYRLLWVLGLLVTVHSFYLLQKTNALGLSRWLTLLFGAAATTILVLVYIDIEAIENLGQSDHDYVGWVGVGNRKEYILRVLIVASLLFAVGELHAVQQVFSGVADHAPSIFRPNSDSALARTLAFFKGADPFASGSCGTFLFLASWNVGAIWNYSRSFRTNCTALKTNSLAFAHHVVLLPRIGFFIVLALFCSAYWFCVWLGPWAVDPFARYFVFIFSGLVVLVFPLRIERWRSWLEKKIAAGLDWHRAPSAKNA